MTPAGPDYQQATLHLGTYGPIRTSSTRHMPRVFRPRSRKDWADLLPFISWQLMDRWLNRNLMSGVHTQIQGQQPRPRLTAVPPEEIPNFNMVYELTFAIAHFGPTEQGAVSNDPIWSSIGQVRDHRNR